MTRHTAHTHTRHTHDDRVEQVIKCWNEEGQEEKVEDGEGAQAGVKVRKGMTTLVLVKPLVRLPQFENSGKQQEEWPLIRLNTYRAMCTWSPSSAVLSWALCC